MKIRLALVLAASLAACSSTDDSPANPDDGGVNADGSSDDGSVDGSTLDGGTADSATSDSTTSDGEAGGPVPTHAAASITLVDHDPALGTLDGIVKITRATDESDVTTYALYWGKSTLAKLTPIASIPKTGSDLTYPLTGAVPAGAGSLLVFAANAAGEMASPISTTNIDNHAVYTDISSGRGPNSGLIPTISIDTLNHKVLVVASDASLPDGGIGNYTGRVYRCDLDGTGCTTAQIAAVEGFSDSAVDAVNQKLLMVTNGPSLTRCSLDGTGCALVDISVGHSGCDEPSLALDLVNQKMLVVTYDANNGYRASLNRCNLDGTSCTFADLSAGQVPARAGTPTGIVDTINSKLVTAVIDGSNNGELGLVRCSLDGTGCVYSDASAGYPVTVSRPKPVIDSVNQKLLTVGYDNSNAGKLALVRCALDGTGCTTSDVSAGQPGNSGFYPTISIDTTNQKLFIVSQNNSNGTRPSVARCNMDGSSCTYADLSAGQGVNSGKNPRAVIDVVNQRLLVVTDNGANGDRPALFSVGL